MKKTYLIHAGWALVALSTFLLGSRFVEQEETLAETQARLAAANSTGLSSRSGVDAGSEGARSSGRTQRSDHTGTAASTPLTENQIKEFGIALRAAKGPLERRAAFNKILENLTVENAKLLREQILGIDDNSSEFREFHYAWGAIAGEEAVLNGADTPERDMAAALAGWAAANPDAALAYYNGLSDEEKNSNELKWGTAKGLSDLDPNLAVQFAAERLASGDRDARRLIELATSEMMRSGDLASAARWATTVPEGELQAAAVSRVARDFADENPVAAAQWASDLPAGDGKNRALWNTYREWAGDDAQAAATKLNAMSQSVERDSAAYGYASRIAWEDPSAGIEWASTIGDEKTRERAIIETGQVFFRKDPEGAKEWLANSGLNEKQQEAVTRRRGRG